MKNNEGKSSTCKVCVTAFMFLMSLCLLLRFSCYYIQLPAFYSKVLSKVCRYSWYTQLTTVTTTEMKAPLRTLFAAVVVTHVSLKLTATKSSSRATEAVILQVAAVYFFLFCQTMWTTSTVAKEGFESWKTPKQVWIFSAHWIFNLPSVVKVGGSEGKFSLGCLAACSWVWQSSAFQ